MPGNGIYSGQYPGGEEMYLITGAAGLLGSHLARSLRDDGLEIRLYDFQTPENAPAGAEFFEGDIRDPDRLSIAMKGVKTVFHLAALMHVGRNNPLLMHSVNIGGLKNVMNCARKAGVSRIVFTSTIELYGIRPADPCHEDSPKNPPPGYPCHKLSGEKMLAEFSTCTGIETVYTRMPMVLGPGFYHFKTILAFFEALHRNAPVFVLDRGDRRGRMVAVCDAVQGLRLCAETPDISGEAFNICADDVFTHRGLIEGLIRKTGSRSRIFEVPSKPVRAAFDALYPLGIMPVGREHFYFSLHHCDYVIDKAKSRLGYRPSKDTVSAITKTYESYISGGRREMKKELANNLLMK